VSFFVTFLDKQKSKIKQLVSQEKEHITIHNIIEKITKEKIMQKAILILLLFAVTCASKAQDSLTTALAYIAIVNNGKEVKLNEQVSDLELTKLVNYKTNTSTLYNFLSKPCILIFWHQFCPTCRKEINTLETLKPALQGKVNILLVTFQSKTSVVEFMDAQKKAGIKFSYPFLVEDTLLRKTFPHEGDPHLVWINTNKKVQAITDHLALTKEHIQQWIASGNLDLPYKHLQKNFDNTKPLLVNNNGGAGDAFQYRSIITGFIDSIKGTPLIIDRNERYTKIFMANSTIDQMFKQLFIKMDTAAKFLDLDWMDKRVLTEYRSQSTTKNLNADYEKGFNAWQSFQQNNLYCYELILPPSYTKEEAIKCMLQDLERYFHIHATIEKREINALALKFDCDTKNVSDVPGEKEIFKTNGDSLFVLKHCKVWSLVNVLNLNYDIPFVIDETLYDGTLSLNLNFYKRDQEAVTKDLHAQHLMLENKKYEIEMLVLRDN